MKKENILNLIKYHIEKDDNSFINEAYEISRYFKNSGDKTVADYILELVTNSNVYVPQHISYDFKYLNKVMYSNKPLFLPPIIENDLINISNAIKKKSEVNKFIFYGLPGTGKTESAYYIAKMIKYNIYTVRTEQLIDSKLGETSKNIVALFNEINQLSNTNSLIIIDEIDSLILDRINNNDLREMGRATSTFISCLDSVSDNIAIIATTNLIKKFDKAVLRRFDAKISFDRYSDKDKKAIALSLLNDSIKKNGISKQNKRIINKIFENCKSLPCPGDIKQMIKTSIAFSDDSNDYDYIKKIYLQFNHVDEMPDINVLHDQKFTSREIEILTSISKSSVSRIIKEGK